MKHWVQRYNRSTKGGFFTMWQYNLFTEDFEVCKSPDSDLWKSMFLMLREKKKKLQLVTYYWRPNLCSAFCITAVSHSSLFMALKRSVMEHVKKGVFVGQLWKEARNSQLTARGKHWFLSSCKAEWGSMKKNQKKKNRKTDKYRSEQWTRKMNLTREVMTSNQLYCVLSTQCNCELEYRLCCAIPRLNIIVIPLRTKTAITEHKSNHFISNTMQWMPWVWFWVRQHRSGNVYGLHW